MDDVLNHLRQRWRLQLPRGFGVVSQTAGSSRVHDDFMGGFRADGGQGGPAAHWAGGWAALPGTTSERRGGHAGGMLLPGQAREVAPRVLALARGSIEIGRCHRSWGAALNTIAAENVLWNPLLTP